MIELIHRHPIAIRILLGVITLTFVLTGGWMLGREDKANYAATVGEEKITMKEYEDAYYKMQEFYRKIFQGNIPPDFEKKLNLNKKAIDTLVDKKLILLAAAKENITVTDQEVTDEITSNKNFLDDKGRFTKARYEDVLKMNGMTPAAFEQAMREDMTAEKYRKMVKDSVYVTEAEMRDYFKKQQESQKKEFKEDEFQAKKEELYRTLTSAAQAKALESFMGGLRSSYKVEINPNILKATT